MLLEKTYTVTIDVDNPINFCTDMKHHANIEINAKYLGRCFKGAYIVKILRIERIGECYIISTNTDAEGTIDVSFVASVIIFSAGDIINGVRILSNQQQQIIIGQYSGGFSEPIASVSIISKGYNDNINASIRAITERHIIPLRIENALHNPMQYQANIVGSIFTCDTNYRFYKIKSGTIDITDFKPIIQEIGRELAHRKADIDDGIKTASIYLFELLLCSFNSPRAEGAALDHQKIKNQKLDEWIGPVNPKPNDLPTINLLDLLEADSIQVDAGLWGRPLTLFRSSPLISFIPAADQLESYEDCTIIENGNAKMVFALFLKEILNWLVAIRELYETYHTKEILGQNTIVLKIMRLMQKKHQ